MRKALRPILLAVLLCSCLAVSANALGKIDINSLVEKAKAFDKQTVTVEGEAIGEVLERGDYAWVNINDSTNAIGIWMTAADAKSIGSFGDYKHVGDTLRITGVFSRSCTEHGGDVDIHCAKFEIIKSGYTVKNEISNKKVMIAFILVCTAAVLAYIYFRVLKKKRI